VVNPQAFSFHITGDGSPSLSFGETGEWMHHAQGAFSETLYVYGEAIRLALRGKGNRFLVVGLGLGYVELLSAVEALRSKQTIYLHSLEADEWLRAYFSNWVEGKEVPNPFQAAYDGMAERFAEYGRVEASQVRAFLQKARELGQWIIEGRLEEATLKGPYSALLFDAFSSATDPELWSVGSLKPVLEAAGPGAVFASYASTSELKRLLKTCGFRLSARAGFGGKRECTLALAPELPG
jgi:hypothetical protein